MFFKLYFVDFKMPSFYKDAAGEYLKRLQKYCKIEVISDKNQKALLKKIQNDWPCLLLTPKGRCLSSEELAARIEDMEQRGNARWSILIANEDKQLYEKLSGPVVQMALTPLFLSEGLTLVTALEQIYRAYKIIHKEPYHK